MQVVVDSVSMNHVVRPPPKKSGTQFVNCLDNPIKDGRLKIALDAARGLQSEWENSCGTELIKILVIKWADLNGIVWIRELRPLGGTIVKQLKNLGFKDQPIDKLVLKLARETNDHIIVSNDSDFWDPSRKKPVGDPTGCVADLLLEKLGIEVMLLATLFQRV